jgi:hypothetical protein
MTRSRQQMAALIGSRLPTGRVVQAEMHPYRAQARDRAPPRKLWGGEPMNSDALVLGASPRARARHVCPVAPI